MSNEENKITDFSYLHEISGGDEGFIAEMIDMFKDQCPEELLEIETAISAKDHERLRNAAHKMKSTVSMLGIKKAAELLIAIQEGAANKQSIEELAVLSNEVKKLCLQAIKELS